MLLHTILGLTVFLTGASAWLFILLVLGIRRGDHGKRLTGKPGSCAELLARRVLTGSRGCDARDNAEDSR
jgi:hypothetical protein